MLPVLLVMAGLAARRVGARALRAFIHYQTPFAFPPVDARTGEPLSRQVVLVLVDGLGLQGARDLPFLGELSLSPVGMSAVTKLAPARLVGSMMGVWFLSISLGNFIGGRVAGLFETFPLPQLFGAVFLTTISAAVVLALLVRPIRGLMSGVH